MWPPPSRRTAAPARPVRRLGRASRAQPTEPKRRLVRASRVSPGRPCSCSTNVAQPRTVRPTPDQHAIVIVGPKWSCHDLRGGDTDHGSTVASGMERDCKVPFLALGVHFAGYTYKGFLPPARMSAETFSCRGELWVGCFVEEQHAKHHRWHRKRNQTRSGAPISHRGLLSAPARRSLCRRSSKTKRRADGPR